MDFHNRKALLDDACSKLTSLWYQYAQILGGELNSSWKAANNAIFACFVGDDHALTEDVQTLHAAGEAVYSLEMACAGIVERREDERARQVSVSPENQLQELNDEDRTFINERRAQLDTVMPEVGELDFHSETGTEGAYWSVEVDGLEGYDALRIIGEGDRLVLIEPDGSTFFDEIIVADYESCWRPYQPSKPYGLGQQECGGLWVHWIPKGRSSKEWAVLFRTAKARGMKAHLYQLPRTSEENQNTMDTEATA